MRTHGNEISRCVVMILASYTTEYTQTTTHIKAHRINAAFSVFGMFELAKGARLKPTTPLCS